MKREKWGTESEGEDREGRREKGARGAWELREWRKSGNREWRRGEWGTQRAEDEVGNTEDRGRAERGKASTKEVMKTVARVREIEARPRHRGRGGRPTLQCSHKP